MIRLESARLMDEAKATVALAVLRAFEEGRDAGYKATEKALELSEKNYTNLLEAYNELKAKYEKLSK